MTEHEVDDFLRSILRRMEKIKTKENVRLGNYEFYTVMEILKEILVEGGE